MHPGPAGFPELLGGVEGDPDPKPHVVYGPAPERARPAAAIASPARRSVEYAEPAEVSEPTPPDPDRVERLIRRRTQADTGDSA